MSVCALSLTEKRPTVNVGSTIPWVGVLTKKGNKESKSKTSISFPYFLSFCSCLRIQQTSASHYYYQDFLAMLNSNSQTVV